MLRLYEDGIRKLRDSPLHPKMQSDGKRYLIDIYYKEEQMNSFRDSLVKQLDRLKMKADQHIRRMGQSGPSSVADEHQGGKIQFDDYKVQYLQSKL